MTTGLDGAIRAARRAAGLTQEDLGRRIGVKARAVSQWEIGKAKPPPRRARELVAAIEVRSPGHAATLRALLGKTVGAPAAQEPSAPPPPDPQQIASEVEQAIYRAADELDLPPRRVRGAIGRVLRRLAAANISLEAAKARIEAWNASDGV